MERNMNGEPIFDSGANGNRRETDRLGGFNITVSNIIAHEIPGPTEYHVSASPEIDDTKLYEQDIKPLERTYIVTSFTDGKSGATLNSYEISRLKDSHAALRLEVNPTSQPESPENSDQKSYRAIVN